jgi:hypothetical protein
VIIKLFIQEIKKVFNLKKKSRLLDWLATKRKTKTMKITIKQTPMELALK